MKILIVGSDINAILLAKYIKPEESSHDIYLTTDDNSSPEIYTGINIRENNINELTDFAKYNGIDFTIAISKLAIINSIADEFKKEGLLIFAPLSEAARITYFNSIAKKILYKLKINTPKFGIFDRENLAIDYARNAKFPLLISNDFTLFERKIKKVNNFSKAKEWIQNLFENDEEKIIIENYLDENPLYVYFITDGYNAYPLISIEKDEEEKAITAPSNKISEEIYKKLLNTVIYPLLDDIAKYSDNYTGIIGIKIILKEENINVLEIYNGFENNDLQVFLSLLDENLINILYETATGSLADDYSYIKLSENYSYTVILPKNDKISEALEHEDDMIILENADEYIITATGKTLNYAKEKVSIYNEIGKEE